MVNWETQADRGPRSPIRQRARGGGRQSKPRPDRKKTPQPPPEPKPAAPRGSPIANKLGRHSAQTWTSIPVPQQTLQVRSLLSPPTSALATSCPALALATCKLPPTRPHYGATVSHRRRLAPRAGSPANWAPRLAVPPSGHQTPLGPAPNTGSDSLHTLCPQSSAVRPPLPYRNGPLSLPKGTLSPSPPLQAGEKALHIAHLR